VRLLLLVATFLVAVPAATAAAPTRTPGELLVALSLPAPGFQVGAVRGSKVTFARGFEVELARSLARRLGVRRIRFVQVADAARLVAPGPKRWDIALSRIVPSPARMRSVELVGPYLLADQAVLLRRGIPRPRSLADLRGLQLCALRGSRGADVVASRVRPAMRDLLAAGVTDLQRWVRTGRCDAAVLETPLLGALAARTPDRFGPVTARIETGVAYSVALPKGSLLVADVERALRALRTTGVTARLARDWFGLEPARLPVLR
jgi:ABC-type amino acid transport substrate-binding protein